MSLFPCVCAPSKIQIKQLQFNLSTLVKTWFHFKNMILFSKIMRFCAAQKSMKIFTLRRACAFSFQSFNFVKNFDFISKIWFYLAKSCVFAPCKKAWKSHLKKYQQCMSFPCACAFSITSFTFVKNFDFLWKISFYLAKFCVLVPSKNTW